MDVPITDATTQLTDLVRRAEGGEEIVLTRQDNATVRLVPVEPAPDRSKRHGLLQAVRSAAAALVTTGPNAARSQDFLYDVEGLPSRGP